MECWCCIVPETHLSKDLRDLWRRDEIALAPERLPRHIVAVEGIVEALANVFRRGQRAAVLVETKREREGNDR